MQLDEIIQRLGEARGRSGPAVTRHRAALLGAALRCELTEAAPLRAYHDLLLHMAAYPDNAAIRRLADTELKRVVRAARAIVREGPRPEARRLADSGIAYTTTTYAYSHAMARWLAARHGRDVEPAWDDDALDEAFDEFLHVLVPSVERDGLLDGDLSTREWIALARGTKGPAELPWLLAQLERLTGDEMLRGQLYDALDVPLRWRLRDPAASRTLNRFPRRPAFHHPEGVLRGVTLASTIDEPLAVPRCLGRRDAEALIDTGRAALAVRHRETDPMSFADPREVMVVPLPRGFDVALYGMQPARRLPLESFFGYIAAKNRVPIAYGGGWVWGSRCEIGINVFESFRGGESSYLFAQLLRVYRHVFEVSRFTVDPFQFGAGNPEAIRSGAFWFYYRFGFRPTSPSLAAAAAEHWKRLEQDRTRRTSASVLRRLALSTLQLDLGTDDGLVPAPDVKALGLAVTGRVGRRFRGDRAAAQRGAVRRMEQVLEVDLEAHPPEQRAAFERLSLLMAMIGDLGRWPDEDLDALADVMLAKGGPRERTYVRRVQAHRRLRAALGKLAAARTPARP